MRALFREAKFSGKRPSQLRSGSRCLCLENVHSARTGKAVAVDGVICEIRFELCRQLVMKALRRALLVLGVRWAKLGGNVRPNLEPLITNSRLGECGESSGAITSSRDRNGRAAQNSTRDEADPSMVPNAHRSVLRRNDQITRGI